MKTLYIFLRDLKVTFRQFIAVWIIAVPVALAFVINVSSPGAADSPVKLALLTGGDLRQAAYLEQYAHIEYFGDMDALENRVMGRDDIVAVVPGDNGGYVILTQGDEPGYIVSAAAALLAYWGQGARPDPSLAVFHDFGRNEPPLKILLTAVLVLLVTVLSGMLISINIVEEKNDRTIRAIRAAPVRLTSFVAGKSLIGVFNSIVCGALCVLAAGFFNVNYPQALTIILSASFISFLVGFITGLNSSDFISAIASLKLLFVPFAASILAVELLGAKWQRLFYWSPFYWAYGVIKGVLSQTARWGDVLLGAGLTMGITLIAYIIFYPGIRKKLI